MQDLWIALSEQPQKIEFAQVDEDKRLLLGAALIPNKKIYRNVDGKEFYITFTEQTIEKLAHNFFKKQKNNNSSLEHELKLEGMSVVEAWTVQDPENDKSNAFGKTYEKGTWVTMMKVDNDEIWNKVKEGEIKGFSIDAVLGLDRINLNTNIEMTEEVKKSIVTDVIDGVKTFFASNNEAAPMAEEVVKEEVKAEMPASDVEALKDALKEVLAQFSTDVDAKLETLKAEFTAQNEVKEKEIETLKAELNKQPEVESVSVSPEAKAEVKLNKQSTKRESVKDRVFKNLSENFWN
jgi:predicted  nucleic acid-binding Zn-ribbon protein